MDQAKNDRALPRWTWIIVIYGALVRTATYLANSSFHHDEAQIALNVVDRRFTDIMHSLSGMQAAPLGFLAAEKLAVILLGPSELALRLFPLIAGIAALILFRHLAG